MRILKPAIIVGLLWLLLAGPADAHEVDGPSHEHLKAIDESRYKAPDTRDLDVIVEAPWRVQRRPQGYLPLMVYVPDAGLDLEKDGGVGYVIDYVSIHGWAPPPPASEPRLIYRDEPARAPEAPDGLEIVDEWGTPLSNTGLSATGICPASSRPCDVPVPGGWHRILRIPLAALPNAPIVYLTTRIRLSPVYPRRSPSREPELYSNTLRIELMQRSLPSFGPSWRYFDAHMHTVAEWSRGEHLTAPRKAYGGPIQMIRESAVAVGMLPSLADFRHRVIATDHNAFFSDDWRIPVGPTADRCLRTDAGPGCGDNGEFAAMREVFGKSFAEELALRTDSMLLSNPNLGSHLLLYRADHFNGPWHGGYVYWPFGGLPRGGEPNDNLLHVVLAKAAASNGLGTGLEPFAFAAHPFGRGNHWLLEDEARNSLERLHCGSRRYVTRSETQGEKFVFKGAQYWNARSTQTAATDDRLNFHNLHPFPNVSSPPREGEARNWPAPAGGLSLQANPYWDRDLQRGLTDYHERVGRLLSFSFCSTTTVEGDEVDLCRCKNSARRPRTVFPRKIYMVAGTDAHGDFNYETSLAATLVDYQFVDRFGVSLRNLTNNAFGRVRTYVDAEGKPGRDLAEKALNALADGNSVLTDGPLLAFEVDADLRFNSEAGVWDQEADGHFDSDGRIGGHGNLDGGFTALIVKDQAVPALRIRWTNTREFGAGKRGRPTALEIYADVPGEKPDVEYSCFADTCSEGEKTAVVQPRWRSDQVSVPSDGVLTMPLADARLVVDQPMAISMAGYSRRRSPSPEEYRVYTNPVWLIPVEVRARSREQGIRQRLESVDVEFVFGMSMRRADADVTLQPLDANGRPVGEPVALQTKGWTSVDAGYGAMADARLNVTNAYSRVPLSPSGEYLVRLSRPRDAHDNPLNSVAARVRLGADP